MKRQLRTSAHRLFGSGIALLIAGASGATTPSGDLDGLIASIEESEYEIASVQEGARAHNRANQLRANFGIGGVEVESWQEGGWQWTCRLEAWGRDGALSSLLAASPATTLNRVEYAHGDLTEWYVNEPSGLEQGFTIWSRPPGNGSIEMRLAIGGTLAEVQVSGDAYRFSADGGPVLEYDDFVAFDARGVLLPLSTSMDGDLLVIRVDDAGAQYPITVDPLLRCLSSSPDQMIKGDLQDGRIGYSMAPAGDINQDGFEDLLVGAPFYSGTATEAGRVYLYFGSATGLDKLNPVIRDGETAFDHFGHAVSTGGDVDNDGDTEIMVGAPYFGSENRGKVYIFYGDGTTISQQADWTREGWVNVDGTGEEFGYAVAGGSKTHHNGSFSSDHFDDIVVGAPSYVGGFPLIRTGRAYSFRGSASGIEDLSRRVLSITSDPRSAGSRFGSAIAVGNVEYDQTWAEIYIGAEYFQDWDGNAYGGVFQFRTGSSGYPTGPTRELYGTGPCVSRYGSALAFVPAGAVGNSHLVVGAPEYSQSDCGLREGAVFAYSWSGTGGVIHGPAPQAALFPQFGAAVASAGDINGDGRTDLLIGAPKFSATTSQEWRGRAYLHLGNATGFEPGSAWHFTGNANRQFLGTALAGLDVDDDGYSDVAVSAPHHSRNSPSWAGAVRMFLGGVCSTVLDPRVSAPSNSMVSQLAVRATPSVFRATTLIRYLAPEGVAVTIDVFDSSGRHVRSLTDPGSSAGQRAVAWDGRDDAGQLRAGGVYFVKLTMGTQEARAKVVLLR